MSLQVFAAFYPRDRNVFAAFFGGALLAWRRPGLLFGPSGAMYELLCSNGGRVKQGDIQ